MEMKQMKRTAENEINFWIEVMKQEKKRGKKEEAEITYKQIDMVIDFAYSIGLYKWKEAEEIRKKAENIKECPFDI